MQHFTCYWEMVLEEHRQTHWFWLPGEVVNPHGNNFCGAMVIQPYSSEIKNLRKLYRRYICRVILNESGG